MSSQLALNQKLSPLEHATKKKKSRTTLESEKVDLTKDWTIYPSSRKFRLTQNAISILKRQPSFVIGNRHQNAADLFVKVFPPALAEKVIRHAYFHRREDVNEKYISLQRFYAYLAQRIWIYAYRCVRKDSVSWSETFNDSIRFPSLPESPKLLLGRNAFTKMERVFAIPTSLMGTDFTDNLSRLVNFGNCLNILDERKEEYHGHCDVIRMNKGTPVIWMIQSAVQCHGSSLPFVHKILPLDFPSKDSNNLFSKKTSILEWASKGMIPGESGLVFDSYYSSRPALSFFAGEKFSLFHFPEQTVVATRMASIDFVYY